MSELDFVLRLNRPLGAGLRAVGDGFQRGDLVARVDVAAQRRRQGRKIAIRRGADDGHPAIEDRIDAARIGVGRNECPSADG